MPHNYSPDYFVVRGCAYVVNGRQEGKDLSLKVDSMTLPNSPVDDKHSLLKQKFKQMCQNISAAKEKVGFEPQDFLKYDSVYTPPT